MRTDRCRSPDRDIKFMSTTMRKAPLNEDLQTRNQGVTLVPDGYKPKHAPMQLSQKHTNSEKDYGKMYPWMRVPLRQMPEEEKHVPTSYRPLDARIFEHQSNKVKKSEGGPSTSSRDGFGLTDSVARRFSKCVGSTGRDASEEFAETEQEGTVNER